MSADGFKVVEDHDIHQGVFLLLNIFAKAVFIWHCAAARDLRSTGY